MLLGHDGSWYQRGTRWPTVVAPPERQTFAIVKATEGTGYVAETLDGDRQGMQDVALPFRGLYHFSHPGKHSPQAEAAFLRSVVGTPAPGEAMVLDHEVEGVDQDWAYAFLNEVGSWSGVAPLLYESYAYAINAPARLAQFQLWVAGYGANNGRIPNWADGQDPYPQKFDVGPWGKSWVLWQFTSQAFVDGVGNSPPTDDSVSYHTPAELIALVGGKPPAPPTPPEDDFMSNPAVESALLFLGAFFQDIKMNKYATAGGGDWSRGMILEGALIAHQAHDSGLGALAGAATEALASGDPEQLLATASRLSDMPHVEALLSRVPLGPPEAAGSGVQPDPAGRRTGEPGNPYTS